MLKFSNIWPILITTPTTMIIGMTIVLITIGCGDGTTVSLAKKSNFKVAENAKNLAEIDKIYNNFEKPIIDAPIGKVLDMSSKISSIAKEIKEIKKINQTNNTGFMSGGAPWLIIVIFLILYSQKHIQHKKTNKELEKQKDTVVGLENTLRILSKETREAEIQCKLSKIRGIDKNETQQEQG